MKQVDLSQIPAEKRAEAMARLQQHYPDQWGWVTDPHVQMAREMFEGRLIVDMPAQPIRSSAHAGAVGKGNNPLDPHRSALRTAAARK